jgi:hypothetical protein
LNFFLSVLDCLIEVFVAVFLFFVSVALSK